MTHRHADSLRRNFARLVIAAVITSASAVPARVYADMNWDGDNAAGNFSFDNNWFNNTQPAWNFGNGNLNFAFSNNTSQTSLFFDYSSWRTTNDIFWLSTYGKSMVLSSNGNGLDFTIRVENQSPFAQTVNMPLSGGKNGVNQMELNPVTADLTLSGPIFNDNSVDYLVYGGTSTLTTLTLNTSLGVGGTAANVDFTQAAGRNTLVNVAASQAWAGTTTVNSGSFVTGSGVTLASPTIVIGGGTVASTSANTFADSATVTVNSGRLSIGGSDTVASLSGSGGTVNVATGATLTAGNASSTSYAGSITGGGNLTKVGSGTFTLSSASSMTGTTTVTAGQFTLASANLLADTSAVVINGGVLSLGGSDTIGSLAGSGGTVAIGANSLTVSQSGNTSFAGTLTGNGTFTKTGSGVLTLTGNASSYAGATQVQAGTVAVNGSLGGSVDVSLGAILSGTGTIGGNVSIAGTQAPGGSGVVGTQTVNGNLTYAAGSILSWDLFANNASLGSYDQISVPNGDLTFSGATSVAMSFNGAGSAVAWSDSFWNVSRSWLVQDLGTGVMNNFNNLSISTQNWLDSTGAAFNTARPGASFTLAQQGQDVLITYVPEPSTIVALIGGLAGVAGFSIRRRRGC
jgi:autotransporter-associated beta strand protein